MVIAAHRPKQAVPLRSRWTAPNSITTLQDAYVQKTIDVLNDLPNVLWIVSQEAPEHSLWWNDHLISLIRAYEKGETPINTR